MKRKTILKEAGVLLITAVMVLSTGVVMANTFGIQSQESRTRLSELGAEHISRSGNMEKGGAPFDTLLFENFDDTWVGSPPAPVSWTQYCTNINAEIWQPNDVRYVSPPYSAYRGGFGSTLPSDDWLVTPEINAAGYDNINLSWWERHGWLQYYSNFCGLWISCGSPDPNDGDYVLIMERIPPDDTVGDWEFYYVILDSYLTDDTFYLALEYDKTVSEMTSCLNIDDVEVTAEESIEPLVADADGPYEAFKDEPIQFQGSAEGGVPPYSFHWDFDDGDTSDIQNPMHTYTNAGNYTVTLTVTDDESDTASDTTWALINGPPSAPIITGETNGKPGTEYEYTFNAVDPDGDNVKYHIDWDDGDSEETDFNPSGTDVKVKHTWSTQGTYIIKAKAVDIHGAESDWAALSVSMPRNRAINSPFLNFLESHPILYQLLLRFLRL